MATARHKFDDEKHRREIDFILPKLKYGVPPSRVVRWLENFEKEDLKYAFDILFYLEYIDGPEMQLRYDQLFATIAAQVPASTTLIVSPIAKEAKSGDLAAYFLNKTTSYAKREKAGPTRITRNLDKIELTGDAVLVLLDDFSGTGDTFHDSYKDMFAGWVGKHKDHIKKIYFLAQVVMQEAAQTIKTLYPDIEIVAERRGKCLEEKTSVFRYRCTCKEIKAIADKYTGHVRNHFLDTQTIPYGYKATQALIAFSYGTPNNTLPIIWTDNKWYPVFPRYRATRMKQASALKREIAHYIGIINRQGLHVEDANVKQVSFKDAEGRKRKFSMSSRDNFARLAVVKLMMDGMEEPVICQALGITMPELRKIQASSKRYGHFDEFYRLTEKGRIYFRNLMAEITRLKNTQPKPDLKKLKKEKRTFVPKTFGGRT